ncbi:hypothetical protein [Isoalcanivorax indicus]|uniref:hypothetical protein n=1 Tax=Isoalcanivorax indicus TaxID=2202653 RepID=UPI0013C41520|nr:hypothetical protein [Isoalcanivorax indicus]
MDDTRANRRGRYSGLPLMVFLGLYFGLSPIYLFDSGLPQLADFVMVCFIFLAAISGIRIDRGGYDLVIPGLVFVFYVFVVSVSWSIILSSYSTMMAPVFYLYNFLAMILVYSSYKKNSDLTLKAILYGISAGLTVSVLYQVLNFDAHASRQAALFNNPNQMGYFGLLCAGISLLIFENGRVSHKYFAYNFILSLLLVFLSFSLTAIAGLFFIVLASVVVLYRKGAKTIVIAPFVFVFSVSFLAVAFDDKLYYVSESVERRISLIETKTENVGDSRGYSRILDYPEYLIFGAAEGERSRFGLYHRHEIHSSLGTVLFSYGVVGFFIFCAFLFSAIRRSDVVGFLIFLGPMVYSLTHQGLRNTIFWIFILLIYLLKGSLKK